MGIRLDEKVLEKLSFDFRGVALRDVSCFLFCPQFVEERFFKRGGEDFLGGPPFHGQRTLVEKKDGGVPLDVGRLDNAERPACFRKTEDFCLGMLFLRIRSSSQNVQNVEPRRFCLFQFEISCKQTLDIGFFKKLFVELKELFVADLLQSREFLFASGFVLIHHLIEQFFRLAGSQFFLPVEVFFFVPCVIEGELFQSGRVEGHLFCDFLEKSRRLFAEAGKDHVDPGTVPVEPAIEEGCSSVVGRWPMAVIAS